MNSKIDRRKFIASSLAGASMIASGSILAQPFIASPLSELVPKTGKRRVVVLGGGWGGLSAAKHIREESPDLEVVLLEKNPFFWSCPLSNKWLIDVVNTDFLAHSYMLPAKKYGYTFITSQLVKASQSQ